MFQNILTKLDINLIINGALLVAIGTIISNIRHLPNIIWNKLLNLISIKVEIFEHQTVYDFLEAYFSDKKPFIHSNKYKIIQTKLLCHYSSLSYFIYKNKLCELKRIRQKLENQNNGKAFCEIINLRFFLVIENLLKIL